MLPAENTDLCDYLTFERWHSFGGDLPFWKKAPFCHHALNVLHGVVLFQVELSQRVFKLECLNSRTLKGDLR